MLYLALAERTYEMVRQMREYLLEEEGEVVKSVFTVNGFNFAGRGQSSGMAFINLKPWSERTEPEEGTPSSICASMAMATLSGKLAEHMIRPVIPPLVPNTAVPGTPPPQRPRCSSLLEAAPSL